MATRRTNQRVTLLMLVLVSVTIITLDYHGEANHAINKVRSGFADVLAPIQRSIAAALHPVGDVFAGAVHYGSLSTENERLRGELGRLRQQVAADDAASASAKELMKLDHVPFVGDVPSVTAVVISPATSNFENTIELDEGTSSGIGQGMPVVGDNGLIGTVLSASRLTATVLLITDSRSKSIGVVAGGSNFVASGSGNGRPLNLAPVPPTTPPRRGEVVTTSASSPLGAFPAGIPVAVVTKVDASADGVVSLVEAKPITNLSDLEFVRVLEWLPTP